TADTVQPPKTADCIGDDQDTADSTPTTRDCGHSTGSTYQRPDCIGMTKILRT
ncbi:unnamed protein product, partial [Staurois parvus]